MCYGLSSSSDNKNQTIDFSTYQIKRHFLIEKLLHSTQLEMQIRLILIIKLDCFRIIWQ